MKQIYNFEQLPPPVLNEGMLRKEIEKRKMQRQTLLLTLASILMQAVVILLGVFVYDFYPILTICCIAYVFIASASSGAVAFAFTKKRGSLI
jgi:hypothetical protein